MIKTQSSKLSVIQMSFEVNRTSIVGQNTSKTSYLDSVLISTKFLSRSLGLFV